jgi:putative transposase
VRRQCELVGLNRATFYLVPAQETSENLQLMRLIDEQYLETPFYGSRKMTAHLRRQGHAVNRKRIQRLMHLMGLEAIYPKPRTTTRSPEHKVYPYLLRNLQVVGPNHVWCADITYLPLLSGFVYLVAIMDWYSRYVLTWQLSNTLDGHFCLDALQRSLMRANPIIFNTDQGVQFTAHSFTTCLEGAGVAVSMDGRGRALDNIFIERLWRSLKYEDIYLHQYTTVKALDTGLHRYFKFHNYQRPHQSLRNQTPAEWYHAPPAVARHC